jgi:hypothetical protein
VFSLHLDEVRCALLVYLVRVEMLMMVVRPHSIEMEVPLLLRHLERPVLRHVVVLAFLLYFEQLPW